MSTRDNISPKTHYHPPQSIDQSDQGLIGFQSNNVIARYAVPYFAFTLSNEIPGVANTGSGQPAVAEDYREAVINWFAGPDGTEFTTLLFQVPTDVSATIDPDLVALIRQQRDGGSIGSCPADWIVEGETDLLCAAFEQGNTWETLASTDLPVQVLWSEEDTLITADHYPSFLFDNPNVVMYEAPLPELEVTGDHSQAVLLGALGGAVLPFVGGEDEHVVRPLTIELQQACKPVTASTPPPLSESTVDIRCVRRRRQRVLKQ